MFKHFRSSAIRKERNCAFLSVYGKLAGMLRRANKWFPLLLVLIVFQCHCATESSSQSSGERMVFEVNDHEVLKPVTSGRWRLSGVLEIRFIGPIEPHENSVFRLFGPGVGALEGRFAKVVLPAGWSYDLKYDDRARTVILSNLHPDRPPAFPGAEGF